MEEYEKAGSPEGYVWGTNWMSAYPGFSLIKESPKAEQWSKILGRPMQEMQLEAEIFQFNFVFHDWAIKKINDETGLISKVLFPLDE